MGKPQKSSGKKMPKDLKAKDATAVKGGAFTITTKINKASPILF